MKSFTLNYKIILASLCGFGLAVTLGYIYTQTIASHKEDTPHPVGYTNNDEVHVHGDFRMYIGDERTRFTDAKYQSSTAHAHHASLHFHDGNDEVIHRHADNVTLVEFFDSIGLKLTNDCIMMDTGTNYCTGSTSTLMLIVNNEQRPDIENYIFAEEDRILLYYGDTTNPNIRDYATGVTDLACMYSGTCPERGTPPTEGCGLTCEVAELDSSFLSNLLQKIKSFFAISN